MFYEWKVCNSSEIASHEFPELKKNIVLENYYNQEYRIWETENAITLYQPGRNIAVLQKQYAGEFIKLGSNDYYRLVLLQDGTYDVYHGQEVI